jgi:hypothetical protein
VREVVALPPFMVLSGKSGGMGDAETLCRDEGRSDGVRVSVGFAARLRRALA